MNQKPPAPSAKPGRPWRWLAVAVVLAAAVALGVSYMERRVLARELITSWLRKQGIESEIAFKAFSPSGLSGTLRIGPAADPDLTAELVQVGYDIPMFWSGKPVRVTTVRLIRPRLNGRWHDGRLSLGSLDPLVERLLKQPPDPRQRPPEIIIEGGVLRLATDYGAVVATTGGQFKGGKLDRLDLTLDPTSLKGSQFQIDLNSSELHLVRYGDRLAVAAEGRGSEAQLGTLLSKGPHLRLAGQIPYPDLVRRTANGAINLQLTTDAQGLATKDIQVSGPSQTIKFAGTSNGSWDQLSLTGVGDIVTQALEGRAGALYGQRLLNRTQVSNLTWSRTGGERIGADLTTQSFAEKVTATPDATLSKVSARFHGPVRFSSNSLILNLSGSLAASGGWRGLGAPTKRDPPADAGLKRALAAARLSAANVHLELQGSDLKVGLPSPIQIRPDDGGLVEVRAMGGPVFARGAGGFVVTTTGGRLPVGSLSVAHYQLSGDRIAGQLHLAAKGSFGPIEDGDTDLSGTFQLAPTGLSLTARHCAKVSVARLELGANDLAAISGNLCPTKGPLLTTSRNTLRLSGALKDIAATVPFLEAKISQVSGPISALALSGDLTLSTQIATAKITDTAKAQRFSPLQGRGAVQLKSQVWHGDFTLSDPSGRALTQAKLIHNGVTGIGGIGLNTGDLSFVEGGLQPGKLSPLAAMIGSPAKGQVQFQGGVDWTGAASTSHGVLDVKHLDFRSPAGPVKGLSGRVVLTSLAPLLAAPGQVLHADGIAGLAAVGATEVSFGLDEKAIQVGGASLALGGGTLSLRPFEIPFAKDAAWGGVADLTGVELRDLVEASPFGDRMDLKAKVSGEIPFSVSPQGLRVSGGALHAIEPGRLSIRREALSEVASDGGTPVAKAPALNTTDPLSDFVYQAMENLDFSALDAKVDSLAEGRLGIVFHIKGEHNPPTRTSSDIRLSWREIVGRKITQKLPLPSGTKVDLTLDTSVNLDQLLADFADYQKARGSAPVQPR